uniref:ATP-grasp domain-containing protein n=1 Tax=Phaeocystis antarctica TaxID=33657 RepID=A0A7S0I4W8_9EUKA
MAAASVRRSSLLLVPLLASALQLRPAVTAPPPRRVLLFVDPCGDTLQTAAIEALGATVLPINSQATADAMKGREWCDADLELLAPLGAPGQGDELCWAAKHLDGLQLEGVLCGSDAGLADAERLQHVLLPERSNGLVAARRDKYLANEACEAAGMATAAQLSPATWAEAEGFVKARCDKGQPTVLKPRRGTASVGVLVASSLPEAKEMFDVLSRSAPSIDASELQADRTVLQERLEGDEWIVDTVSCGGVHKVVALWRYDKGVANGAPFVYFGAELMSSGEAPPDLAAYACAALDALSWRWGPAHLEV